MTLKRHGLGVGTSIMSKSCTSRGCTNGISIYPTPSIRSISVWLLPAARKVFLNKARVHDEVKLVAMKIMVQNHWHRWNPDAAIKKFAINAMNAQAK